MTEERMRHRKSRTVKWANTLKSPTGIDYSPVGCDQAKAILASEGDVMLADISSAPSRLLHLFNYVVSFGTGGAFGGHRRMPPGGAFHEPSGTIFTLITNMNGLVGSRGT